MSPTNTKDKTATAEKKPRKKQVRNLTEYALAWVTESEPERDGDGNPIPGTARRVFVLMDLPPGLDDAGKRNRNQIRRACEKAVYELGMEEFGNKDLTVISLGETYRVEFKRTKITKLLPPDEVNEAKNGGGVVEVEGDE